jgi:hypothetical protein
MYLQDSNLSTYSHLHRLVLSFRKNVLFEFQKRKTSRTRGRMDELDGVEDEGGGRCEGRHGQEEEKECNKKRVMTAING